MSGNGGLHLVDANVLIEAANNYYTFDRVPGFWDWLQAQCVAGSVKTVSLVFEEIEHPQELNDWVTSRASDGFFVDVSEAAVQAEYAQMAAWVIGQQYGPQHVAKFLNGADLWIIASAKVMNATVVTQEKSGGAGTKRIKIPDVCSALGVPCMNTFQMLDALKAKF